ncbi:FG-GAP-like repeat-containing protein [Bradyrhizobium sp. USDA 4529]
MATYTHFSGAIDPSQEALFSGGIAIESYNSTSIFLIRDDGIHITLSGSGITRTYDPNIGDLWSGTITSVSIQDANSNPIASITGESINPQALMVPNGTSQPYFISSSLFSHNDTLLGNNGDEHLSAGLGNDVINGFLGANRIDGGAGYDIVNINASWTSASFQHNNDGSWTVGFAGGFDLVQNVESLHFSDAMIALREPTRNDFGALGHSNVLYYNPTSTLVGNYDAAGVFNTQFGASAESLGTGDFNGDGTTDIAIRFSNGAITIVQETLNRIQSTASGGASSLSYSVEGFGDFNGDGLSDILFRNNSTGDVGFNQTSASNGNVSGSAYVSVGGSSTSYQIEGVGDFNGNSVSDILFRNHSTGDLGFFRMDQGGSFGGYIALGGSSTAYSAVGVGDFNGDGTSDILFRNNSTGDFGFDQINSGVVNGYHALGGSSTSYQIADVGDYTGDGTADILFRNTTTGETGYYDVHNGLLGAWHQLQTVDPGFHVVA